MNDQRSLNDQIGDLIAMANKAGLYDAADFLLMGLVKEDKTIFEECNNRWKRQIYDWRRRASKAVTEPERYPALQWIEGFIESATLAIGSIDAEANTD